MKKEFIALVSVASEKFKEIIKTAFTQTDNKTLHLCINAYNTYQENERNSVDYLFNAKDKNDVITCLNGGLTLQELYRIYGSKQAFKKEITSFFMFGCNHPTIKVMSPISLIGNLCAYSEEIVENMLLYPHSYDREFYNKIFTENLVV